MPEVLGQDSPPSLLVNCLLIKYSSSLQCIHTAQAPFSRVCHSALITLLSGRHKRPKQLFDPDWATVDKAVYSKMEETK